MKTKFDQKFDQSIRSFFLLVAVTKSALAADRQRSPNTCGSSKKSSTLLAGVSLIQDRTGHPSKIHENPKSKVSAEHLDLPACVGGHLRMC